jgi:hypothetical protein
MSKDSKHNASSTQESVKPTGGARKTYTSGANVHKGGGPGPSKPAPASQPKQDGY